MNSIFVVGATGPQGRTVVEQFIKNGFSVRALVRNTKKADSLREMGAELFEGDLDDASSIMQGMKNQDGVFLTVPFFDGTVSQAEAVIAAAKHHQVKKLVWNVAGKVQDFDTGNPAVDKWRSILRALEASEIPFVVIEPTVYMENFLNPFIAKEVKQKSTIAYPMPESVKCQWISHQDAAAYVVAALRDGRQDGYRIRVCGPELLTGQDIADRFTAALGRKIEFRPMPPSEFAQGMHNEKNSELIVGYYRAVAADASLMTTDIDHDAVLKALPIVPLNLQQWVERFQPYFH